MSHLVFGVVLFASCGRVASANDCDGARFGGLHDLVHHELGALLECLHLEDTHGPVPDDGLAPGNGRGIQLVCLWTTVKAHKALRDAGLDGGVLDLAVLAVLGGTDKVNRQYNFDALFLGLGHDLRNDLGAFLIEEGVANADAPNHLDEGESHATSNDHSIYLVQHVLNQLDLVADLGSSQNGTDWADWRIQNLCEGLQLLGHEEARALHRIALSHHRAVSTVGSAKGIATVDVRQLRQGGPELLGLFLVGLDLVAILVDALAFFFYVESAVLQQNHRATRRVGTSSFNLCSTAILQERHRLAQLLLDTLGHRSQRVLLYCTAIRSTKMGTKHHRFAALIQTILDGGQCCIDTLGVGDHAGVLLVLRHIEVHADENSFPGHIH
mmetsp:Transcript_53924/g.109701  ORF Transcript_53924/g.109701 Transcript_53924/m.109701 type:complete len:383 (+) Transcript_53924:568-1716(+)